MYSRQNKQKHFPYDSDTPNSLNPENYKELYQLDIPKFCITSGAVVWIKNLASYILDVNKNTNLFSMKYSPYISLLTRLYLNKTHFYNQPLNYQTFINKQSYVNLFYVNFCYGFWIGVQSTFLYLGMDVMNPLFYAGYNKTNITKVIPKYISDMIHNHSFSEEVLRNGLFLGMFWGTYFFLSRLVDREDPYETMFKKIVIGIFSNWLAGVCYELTVYPQPTLKSTKYIFNSDYFNYIFNSTNRMQIIKRSKAEWMWIFFNGSLISILDINHLL